MDDYDDEDYNKTPTPQNGGLNFFSRNSSRASSSTPSNNLFNKTARERTDASSASSRASGKVGFQANVQPRGTNSRATPINSVRRSVSLRTGSSAAKTLPERKASGRNSVIAKTTDDIKKKSTNGRNSVSNKLESDNSKLVLDSNAINSLFCEPCQQQCIDVKAESYCKTCEEALCDSCAGTHRNSKITRDHAVLLLDEMSNPRPKAKDDQYPSKPGKPEKISIESTTCTISWEPSTGPVDCYEVRYKVKTSKTWSKVQTEGPQCMFTVQNLKGRTAYNFQVRGIAGSIEGPFSYVSEPYETKVSLAWRLMQSARKVEDGSPAKYKLELDEKLSARNEKAKTRKCVLGNKRLGVPVGEKTIMMVGATGAGKTTLVDGMINFITDVALDDEFRFTMIDLTSEEKNKESNQAISQTEWITCYQICHQEGCKVPFSVNIIDTPGFGDTRGIKRDEAIVEQIRSFFTTPGDIGIQTLDAVCFVVQSPLARLSPSQRYIFHSILSIFGKDIVDNIFVLITFADGNIPPVLASLKEAEVPFKEHFSFNNSALFVDPTKNKTAPMFWEMGQESFDIFFRNLQTVQTKSLQLTAEVLVERRQIELNIKSLQEEIKVGLHTLHRVEIEKKIIKDHEKDINANKNFIFTVPQEYFVKVMLPPGQHTTTCLRCNRTCHDDCTYLDNDEKHKCFVFNKRGFCTICIEHCYWREHVNCNYIYQMRVRHVTGELKELRQKYQIASNEKEKHEKFVKAVTVELNKQANEVWNKMKTVRKSLQRLSEIALRPNPLTDVEYVKLLIENEKREAKPGWQTRVQMLEELKQRAQIITEMPEKKSQLWETVKAKD
ncbi:Hypothetical predicted protein [Mytilus galloprovincialis]|uniref:Fibronectin type-III domain-containing protein n=2 Tax=Mytilus TaxID=6548 RepID=A0A8B6HQU4_MYTGA|nr:Hypothetical predicted protein [Mytilus galloprovincialis]